MFGASEMRNKLLKKCMIFLSERKNLSKERHLLKKIEEGVVLWRGSFFQIKKSYTFLITYYSSHLLQTFFISDYIVCNTVFFIYKKQKAATI